MNKRYFLPGLLALFILSCGPDKPVITELFPMKTGKQYGYIDRAGKNVIASKFSKAGCFSDDLAVVATADSGQQWGYIDKTGNYVITPAYTSATTFSEHIAFVVAENGAPKAIDKKGAVLFTIDTAAEAENFSEGLAAFSVLAPEGELWGFVNKRGKLKIPPAFHDVGYFSGKVCGVMNERGIWGYINKKGETVIGFRYDNVYPFEHKQAKVSIQGKWGVIDEQGKGIIATRYANLDIDGDRYLVKDGAKWGWVNKEDKVIITAQYDDAFPFNGGGYAAVKQGDKWGYIDEAGKMVIQPKFDFAFGFDGDMALVEVKDKYGFIDREGKYVIEPAFDNVALDYFIRFFARTSHFYSVKTNKNLPANIAWKWLTAFYHLEYDEAKKISTDETKKLLQQFSELTGIIADSTRQRMAGIIVGIRECKENGDRAIATYSLSDNPQKEQLLFLVRKDKDSRWQVQFTKNDQEGEAINSADIRGRRR